MIAAKVGDLGRDKGLVSLLAPLVGPTPQRTNGPHGEAVLVNPAGDGKRLSAYALWRQWLFVAAKQEALEALLKRADQPLRGVLWRAGRI